MKVTLWHRFSFDKTEETGFTYCFKIMYYLKLKMNKIYHYVQIQEKLTKLYNLLYWKITYWSLWSLLGLNLMHNMYIYFQFYIHTAGLKTSEGTIEIFRLPTWSSAAQKCNWHEISVPKGVLVLQGLSFPQHFMEGIMVL